MFAIMLFTIWSSLLGMQNELIKADYQLPEGFIFSQVSSSSPYCLIRKWYDSPPGEAPAAGVAPGSEVIEWHCIKLEEQGTCDDQKTIFFDLKRFEEFNKITTSESVSGEITKEYEDLKRARNLFTCAALSASGQYWVLPDEENLVLVGAYLNPNTSLFLVI